MEKQRLQQLMHNGFEKLKPHIEGMTHSMMDCYKQGFSDCWQVLTGKELDL